MKHARLVIAALAVCAVGSWTTHAFASDDKAKSAAASSNGSVCTAAMAAKCTPEMAAACKAKSAAAASNGSACSAAMSAKCTAEMAAACKAKGASAASAMTACPHAVKAGMGTASACPYHNQNSAVDAVFTGTGNGKSSCGAKGAAAASGKMAGGSCDHGAASAAATGGSTCSGHGAVKMAERSSHMDCDACADMAYCDGEVHALGATVQIVPLKNGVMYVYTAESPSKVQAVQASMSRRNDHLASIFASGDKVKLCSECKAMRGAVASGKLNRELVNIEGGCLTLMTSTDPAMIARIYTIAGIKGPLASKS
jgi:hypothetical protein